ncbi:hypothetical protein MRS44_001930 [Fusarium solani]|nr:hypothetical protein MRS44_001930 [Fusarium solani]
MNRAVPKPLAERPERPTSTLPMASEGDSRSPVCKGDAIGVETSRELESAHVAVHEAVRPDESLPTTMDVMVVNGPGAVFANGPRTHRGPYKTRQRWTTVQQRPKLRSSFLPMTSSGNP